MITYLDDVVNYIKPYNNISSLTIILPSKRAGLVLKRKLLEQNTETLFAPQVLSIEEFVENISSLKIAPPINLLLYFYETYLTTLPEEEKDDFETFSAWASTLLNDFNEIDRYLIHQANFFNYLSAIQDLNHWVFNKDKSPLVGRYISFWKTLHPYYKAFCDCLLKKGIAHQGLVYREASANIQHYIKANPNKKHLFIGFNALNNAEQHLIQELLEQGNNKILWDIDQYFLERDYHDASLFIRRYLKTWPYFKNNNPSIISKAYQDPKDIHLVGSSKTISQLKYVGNILKSLSSDELDKTVLVLADETLLIPMLNSLPQNCKKVNITMGFPLRSTNVNIFFNALIKFHSSYKASFYYKDLFQILLLPSTQKLIGTGAQEIISELSKYNITSVSLPQIKAIVEQKAPEIELLFTDYKNQPLQLCKAMTSILDRLKAIAYKEEDKIELETLYTFNQIFNNLISLHNNFKHLKTIASLLSIFKETVAHTTLNFKGNSQTGLQIMGLLETRCLDFETLIMTSVNEGVLPSGKSNNSFISFDLKKQYNLPGYKEKDAVYTYHFYRLLQRVKKAYLIYNTENEGLGGGEKSRFLTQLEVEKPPQINLIQHKVSLGIKPVKQQELSIYKTPSALEKLKALANYGFSPSALTAYLRNPLDFYNKKVLGIKDLEEVEETIAFNTLGTVVHDSLYNLYKPFIGEFLSIEGLNAALKKAPEMVTSEFKRAYKKGDFNHGKNRIIFEVAKQYVTNFLNFEIKALKQAAQIKIIALETKLKTKLECPQLDFPVFIGGIVDRIDELNGQLRIIDYKTGKVELSDLKISQWEDLSSDYKYHKIIQVLGYALMLNSNKPIEEAQAGIISFKNLKAGFIPFAKKEIPGNKSNPIINQEVLNDYKVELKKLILEICNPNIPFIEKHHDN